MTTTTTRMPPPWADRTLQLLREGYLFLPRLRRREGTDLVALRLLGKPAVAVHGPEAAEMFYQRPEIKREGAVPGRVQRTLFGEGGVQSLDGEHHRHRKDMFMQIMSPDRVKELGEVTTDTLRRQADGWFRLGSVNLSEASREVLMEAGAAWAGVPLPTGAVGARARQMATMVDTFATVGPRHWMGRRARRRAEGWIASLVEEVRAGRRHPPPGSALAVISSHRDPGGALLPARVAAVEVLNVIRPLVAVGRLVAFTGLALHRHGGDPESDEELKQYAHEVRRFYPFVPFVGGRVDREFVWGGVRFPAGGMVLLDIYGMNHDRRLWDQPQRFRPDRFRAHPPGAYDFIPQGGGDFHRHHRCAGEDATIVTMMAFTRFLAREMSAELPPQDLTIDPGRIPARVASGVLLEDLRPRGG